MENDKIIHETLWLLITIQTVLITDLIHSEIITPLTPTLENSAAQLTQFDFI